MFSANLEGDVLATKALRFAQDQTVTRIKPAARLVPRLVFVR
jgi:hypothetical protein